MEIRIILISIAQNKMENSVIPLYRSSKTVFTNKDLALLWQEKNKLRLNAKTAYYVKKKALIRLTRGVFAKSNNFCPKELATRVYTPSYISFETVLREAGVIFQHYETLFVASQWTKNFQIDSYTIRLRKLKDTVLFNTTGIILKENYSIATTERAFLDMIYLFPKYYFDNLQSIHWDKCDEIVKIYNNKQLVQRLAFYRKNYA
jgi:hypothetical protein